MIANLLPLLMVVSPAVATFFFVRWMESDRR